MEHILRTLVMDYIHLLLRFVIKKDSKKHYPADLLIKPCINMEMVQKYKPQSISLKRRRIFEFIIDETQIKVDSSYFWI
jgi:hypothetical protein